MTMRKQRTPRESSSPSRQKRRSEPDDEYGYHASVSGTNQTKARQTRSRAARAGAEPLHPGLDYDIPGRRKARPRRPAARGDTAYVPIVENHKVKRRRLKYTGAGILSQKRRLVDDSNPRTPLHSPTAAPSRSDQTEKAEPTSSRADVSERNSPVLVPTTIVAGEPTAPEPSEPERPGPEDTVSAASPRRNRSSAPEPDEDSEQYVAQTTSWLSDVRDFAFPLPGKTIHDNNRPAKDACVEEDDRVDVSRLHLSWVDGLATQVAPVAPMNIVDPTETSPWPDSGVVFEDDGTVLGPHCVGGYRMYSSPLSSSPPSPSLQKQLSGVPYLRDDEKFWLLEAALSARVPTHDENAADVSLSCAPQANEASVRSG